ncbi:Sua5/YciO/YrdC/YwlC family protein [Arhodomonas sp. SL1]|uniref:Sua5/YciO/YrdC/YwlC family protein n=1 Tax=Arhodomonas sp. SL1 TaxID=3425691 RepID=UPI003F882B44
MTATPGFRFRHVARRLRAGGVIAYPTEAVYGLGCDPADPHAVARLLNLKSRPVEKGLILIADRPGRLQGWADAFALSDERLAASWPGPVTWLMPAGPRAPAWITGGSDRIAVRVTAHPVAAALAAAFAGPLVSTSANPAGAHPARTALRVRTYFDGEVDGILGGAVDRHRGPTEIRRWPDGAVLRAG